MGAKREADEKAKKEGDETKMEEDLLCNKRRAEETLPEKEPSEKKPKTNRKKKALAAGGVNMFGGKDLFGGKNPFAGRKQELSSDEEEEVEELETDSPTPSSHNGGQAAPPPPPPPPVSSVNIAVQPDADEKPVSFDDLPSDCHLMGSTTKSRVSNLPSRRRPTGKGRNASDPVSNGHPPPPPSMPEAGKFEQASTAAANTAGNSSVEVEEQTNKLTTDRLALPTAGNESEEYDGDESELSRSVVKRGRRSIKKKQPPKGGVALFGGADLFKGKNPFAHRRDDSDEKEGERSRSMEPADDKTNDEITVVESQSAMEQRLAKVEREKRETVKREEQDKKPEVVLRKTEKKLEEKKLGDEKGSDSPDSSTKVWEVKEDQKAAAVQRLLMKKVKEAKEKEAREAEEKKEQRLDEEAAQWKKEEGALKRSQEERIKR